MASGRYVLAITGASGTAYAVRLTQVLLRAGCQLHIVISEAARQVSLRELGADFPSEKADTRQWISFFNTAFCNSPAEDWGFAACDLPDDAPIVCHSVRDFSSGIASGSFSTNGMVVCPCSMGSLSSIASGASSNLIQRAADVHLKERRPLILVPRETPLGLIALENMTRVTRAGATVLPSMPGFYQNPKGIADLVDFVVARICDHLGVAHSLIPRWGDSDR